MEQKENYLKISSIAEKLNLTKEKITAMIEQGIFQNVVKLPGENGAYLIPESEITKFLNNHKITGEGMETLQTENLININEINIQEKILAEINAPEDLPKIIVNNGFIVSAPVAKFPKMTKEELAESIKKNGIINPIIISDIYSWKNIIIGGYDRLEIAKQLGLKQIPFKKMIFNTILDARIWIRGQKNLACYWNNKPPFKPQEKILINIFELAEDGKSFKYGWMHDGEISIHPDIKSLSKHSADSFYREKYMAELKADIEANGVKEPLIIYRNRNNTGFMIFDGLYRWTLISNIFQAERRQTPFTVKEILVSSDDEAYRLKKEGKTIPPEKLIECDGKIKTRLTYSKIIN